MIKLILMASLLGSIIWGLFFMIRPFTKRKFTNTWHYYVSLIPVFFMCGGFFMFSPIFKAITELFKVVPLSHQVQSIAHGVPIPMSQSPIRQQLSAIAEFDFSLIIYAVTAVWAIGVVIFMMVNVFSFMMFKQGILNQAVPFSCDKTELRLMKSQMVTTPILIGILKPIIIIPDIEMTGQELDIILKHELIHKRRGDLIVKLIVFLANALHWFNPIAYHVSDRINGFCETSCDEQVVSKLSVDERKFYGKTILNVLSKSRVSNCAFYTGLATGKDNLKGRLINIMQFEKSKKNIAIISVVVALLVLLLGVLVAFSMGIGQKKTPIPDAVPVGASSDEVSSNIDTSSQLSASLTMPEPDTSEDSSSGAVSSENVASDFEAYKYEANGEQTLINDGYITRIENNDTTSGEILEERENALPNFFETDDNKPGLMYVPTLVKPLEESDEVRVTATFGERETITGKIVHTGVDIAAEKGTDISAVDDGTVIKSGWDGSFGLTIEIDHGNRIVTKYAHCSKLLLKEGDIVKQGDIIAQVGSTGNAAGDHLHLEMKVYDERVDPSGYVDLTY